MNKRLFLKVKE